MGELSKLLGEEQTPNDPPCGWQDNSWLAWVLVGFIALCALVAALTPLGLPE